MRSVDENEIDFKKIIKVAKKRVERKLMRDRKNKRVERKVEKKEAEWVWNCED